MDGLREETSRPTPNGLEEHPLEVVTETRVRQAILLRPGFRSYRVPVYMSYGALPQYSLPGSRIPLSFPRDDFPLSGARCGYA